MTGVLAWGLLLSAFAVVTVRRRSVAIALVAAQSMLLGVAAIVDAAGASTALLVGGVVLLAKGVALPLLLGVVVARTREPRHLVAERHDHALVRLTVALAMALGLVALTPRLGLTDADIEHTAIALVTLGVATAAVRRAAIFQALGFLVAENGLYLAALHAPGGVPAFIELGLVFDLVVVMTVAAAFSVKIHAEFGTGDAALMEALRD